MWQWACSRAAEFLVLVFGVCVCVRGVSNIFILVTKLLASVQHIKVGDVSRRMCTDIFIWLLDKVEAIQKQGDWGTQSIDNSSTFMRWENCDLYSGSLTPVSVLLPTVSLSGHGLSAYCAVFQHVLTQIEISAIFEGQV